MSPSLSPALRRALLASLAIHALVLAGGGVPALSLRRPEAPLKAVLGSGGAAAGAPRPALPPSPAAPEEPRTKAQPRRAVHAPAPLSRAAPPPPLAEAGVAAATAPPAEGISADGMRQYRLALAREARLARDASRLQTAWEGRAEVAVTVGGASPAPTVALERSSGLDPLDREAMELVARAARRALLPESLRGREFRLVLAIEFSAGD